MFAIKWFSLTNTLVIWIWELRYFQAIKDNILVRCRIGATFAPPTFEDKKRLQTDSKGIRSDFVGQSLSWEHERDGHLPKANQNTTAARLALRYKHTAMAWWFDSAVPSLSRVQERDHPYEANHNATAARLSYCWRQIICYSEIFNYSFHFRRLRTYLYGFRTETDYTYLDTYYIYVLGTGSGGRS